MRIRSVFATVLLAAQSAHAAPFDTADQNPLLAGFGVPRPFSARMATTPTTTLAATLNWSNIEVVQQTPTEWLSMDAEIRDWRFTVERVWPDKFATRIAAPYRSLGAGSLDHFIEHWHSLTGLPNGQRGLLPRDAYGIEYQRFGRTIASYARGASGIGDLSLALGYQLHSSTRAATSVWWTAKLPTGDSDRLLGSGSYDTALSVANEYALSSHWSLASQTNAVYFGNADVLPTQRRRFAFGGLVCFEYAYSSALTLKMQLDAHTAIFKSSALDLLRNAWILTFGGDYRFGNHWFAEFGIGEDVKVEASPDVVFVLRLERNWK